MFTLSMIWPKKPINNLKSKNWFEATNIVKNSDKEEKYVYSGYGITSDIAGSWSFVNVFARYVIIFGADNIS